MSHPGLIPAFPGKIGPDRADGTLQFSGMNLLDHFAAIAMQGLLSRNHSAQACGDTWEMFPIFDTSKKNDRAELAKRAYDIAAEMVDRRELIYIMSTSDEL